MFTKLYKKLLQNDTLRAFNEITLRSFNKYCCRNLYEDMILLFCKLLTLEISCERTQREQYVNYKWETK